MREQPSKSEQMHINRFLQLAVGIKSLEVSINTDRHRVDKHCTINILHNKGSGRVLDKTHKLRYLVQSSGRLVYKLAPKEFK